MRPSPSFSLFWMEHKKYVFDYTIKFLWAYPLALIFGGFLTLIIHAALPSNEVVNFYKLQDFLIKQTWVDIYPKFIYGIFLGYVIALPVIHLSVLYLEWDKYKKDEAPHLGGYWGWTVPNRPWSRSNFQRLITGEAWAKYPQLTFHANDEKSSTVTGRWTDEELLRIINGISRRYTSFLRKPLNQTADLVEWHFLINGGDELRLKFERLLVEPTHWTLTVGLYEWAGRKQPPRLAQTHVTKFVLEKERLQ